MAFTLVTLTRTYKTATGANATGAVILTPTVPMVNGHTVVSRPITAQLVSGAISVQVPANTDTDTAPVGTSYLVQEILDGVPAPRSYYIVVPHDQGPLLGLHTLEQQTSPPELSFPVPGPKGEPGDPGAPGAAGAPGAPGPGVPAGGAAGQLLVKTSSTDYATEWADWVDPWTFNVRAFGAVGDGVSDDAEAIQDAIDACQAAGGGTVFFPAGSYSVGAPLSVTGSNVWLRGAGRGATILEKADDIALVTFEGATGEDHLTDCGITGMTLRGADHSGVLLDLLYVTRFSASELHCFGNDDTAIDTVEVWDSRITNVWVEWCSSDTAPAVWVRSSRETSGRGASTDSTNQLVVVGLLVESWRGGAIRVEQGEGSPEGIYGVHFYGTKIETHMVRGPAIHVGDGSSNISFVDTYAYLDDFADGYSTPVDAVELGGLGMNKLDGLYIGVGNPVLVSGVNITGSGAVLTNVEGQYSNGAPSSGSHVRATGGTDYTLEHIRADGVTDLVSGLSTSVQAYPGNPLRVVNGAVSNASFPYAPPIGTLAVDTANNRLYVKTGASTWRYTALT